MAKAPPSPAVLAALVGLVDSVPMEHLKSTHPFWTRLHALATSIDLRAVATIVAASSRRAAQSIDVDKLQMDDVRAHFPALDNQNHAQLLQYEQKRLSQIHAALTLHEETLVQQANGGVVSPEWTADYVKTSRMLAAATMALAQLMRRTTLYVCRLSRRMAAVPYDKNVVMATLQKFQQIEKKWTFVSPAFGGPPAVYASLSEWRPPKVRPSPALPIYRAKPLDGLPHLCGDGHLNA